MKWSERAVAPRPAGSRSPSFFFILLLLLLLPLIDGLRPQAALLVSLPQTCGDSGASAAAAQLPGAAAAAIAVANAALANANANAPYVVMSAAQAGACAPALAQLAAICAAVTRDRPFAAVGPSPASSLALAASALGAAGLPLMGIAASASDSAAAEAGDAATWRSLLRVAPPEDVVARAVAAAISLFGWQAVTIVRQGDAFGNRGFLALSSAMAAASVNVDASLTYTDAPSAAAVSSAIRVRSTAGQPVIVVAWCDDAMAPTLFFAAAAAGLFSSPLVTWLTTSAALPASADASKFSGLLVVRPSPRDFAGSSAAAPRRAASAAVLLGAWPASLAATKPATTSALDPAALFLADAILTSAAALLDAWTSNAVQITSDSVGSFVSWANSVYTRSAGGSGCLDPLLQPASLSPLSTVLASASWPSPSAALFPFVTGPLTASLASRRAFFNSTNSTISGLGAALSRAAYTLELANLQASGAVSVAMLFDSVSSTWSGSSNLTLTWPTGAGSAPPPSSRRS